MLDDEARRTLEEEAIALVSLSNPSASLRFRRDERPFAAPSHATHPRVRTCGPASPPPSPSRAPAASATSSELDRRLSPNPAASTDARKPLPTSSTAPPTSAISMRSLLVTLKKRKLSPDALAAAAAARALPSFRDVFDASHQPAHATSSSNAVALGGPEAPALFAPADIDDPTAAAAAAAPLSAALKCKYRTGKCSNARALKSCGDYHNLCNYHRLRANANQRKLDRKKKTQRQTNGLEPLLVAPASADAGGSASPASVAAALVDNDDDATASESAAAAAALVAMPTFVKREPTIDDDDAMCDSNRLTSTNNSNNSNHRNTSDRVGVKQEERRW